MDNIEGFFLHVLHNEEITGINLQFLPVWTKTPVNTHFSIFVLYLQDIFYIICQYKKKTHLYR